jgi:hypothetical protein
VNKLNEEKIDKKVFDAFIGSMDKQREINLFKDMKSLYDNAIQSFNGLMEDNKK